MTKQNKIDTKVPAQWEILVDFAEMCKENGGDVSSTLNIFFSKFRIRNLVTLEDVKTVHNYFSSTISSYRLGRLVLPQGDTQLGIIDTSNRFRNHYVGGSWERKDYIALRTLREPDNDNELKNLIEKTSDSDKVKLLAKFASRGIPILSVETYANNSETSDRILMGDEGAIAREVRMGYNQTLEIISHIRARRFKE